MSAQENPITTAWMKIVRSPAPGGDKPESLFEYYKNRSTFSGLTVNEIVTEGKVPEAKNIIPGEEPIIDYLTAIYKHFHLLAKTPKPKI